MSTVKESLSIEETNKIRVSLGLKPLPVPTDGDSGGDSKPKDAADDAPQDADSLAEANYAARRSKEAQEKATADLQARLDRSKNKRELAAKLKGRGLGDLIEGEADESTDLKSWIKKSKKRQKQLAAEAAKKEKELAELEGPAYAEKDLEGLKVGHEAEDFEQGEDVILTLKDSRILDGDEDELHNVNLSEAAKSKEALALKRKGRQEYTGLDDEEFEGVPGQRKEVLNKYKETIEGKEGRSFRLGAAADERPDAAMEVDQIGGVAEASRQSRKAAAAEELKRELLSGEYQSKSLLVAVPSHQLTLPVFYRELRDRLPAGRRSGVQEAEKVEKEEGPVDSQADGSRRRLRRAQRRRNGPGHRTGAVCSGLRRRPRWRAR